MFKFWKLSQDANEFSYAEMLQSLISGVVYVNKWWAPMDNSTFIKVPDNDFIQFKEEILLPFFNVALKTFAIK
jgi:hypothetical protein